MFDIVFIECREFALIRKHFFKVNCLRNLFDSDKMVDVLSFLKEIGLHQKTWFIETM